MRRLSIALTFAVVVGCQSNLATPARSSNPEAALAAPSPSPSPLPSPTVAGPTIDQVMATSFAAMQKVSSVRYTVTADGKVLPNNPTYQVRSEQKFQAPDKSSSQTLSQGSFINNVYYPDRFSTRHSISIGLQQWSHTDAVDSKGTVQVTEPWKFAETRTTRPFPSATFGRITPAEVMTGSRVMDLVGPTLEGTEARNGVLAYRITLSANRENGLVAGFGPGTSGIIPNGPTLYAASVVTVWIDSTTMLWQRVERIDRNLTDPSFFIHQVTDYSDYDKVVISPPPGF